MVCDLTTYQKLEDLLRRIRELEHRLAKLEEKNENH